MGRMQMIPAPVKYTDLGGAITVTSANSIVFKTGAKKDAFFLQQKIVDMGGPRIPVTAYLPASGDIQVMQTTKHSPDCYNLNVDDFAKLSGHPDNGIHWAIASLLQIAIITPDAVTIPRLSIKDKPASKYRGVMIDLASEWHPLETLYDIVVMCWWYKLKYLHLHFTDDKSWTLPSKRYPCLPTQDRHYSFDQLQALNNFAISHGVTIIPEVDVPGHSRALVKALPELVGNEQAANTSTTDDEALIHPGMTGDEAQSALCPGRESTYQFLAEVIDELCEIFPNTPYIHIGADEVNKAPWTNCIHCQDYMKQHEIPDVEELYRHFIVRINECVRQHGKQTIVWEGFKAEGVVDIPRDVIVMEFENHYELPAPLLNAGYELINTSWQPLYIVPTTSWSAEQILKWHIWRWEHWWEKSLAHPDGIEVKPTNHVLGAGMCSWGLGSDIELPALLPRLPALAERTWNTTAPVDYDTWLERWKTQSSRLERLLHRSTPQPLPITPLPKQYTSGEGSITISPLNRIVCKKNTKPCALFLQQKIIELGGPTIPVEQGSPAAGDIQVGQNSKLKPDCYVIDVYGYVDITGHPSSGMTNAIASLLQIATITPGAVTIPRLRIKDHSDTAFRSVMIDLVSRWHPIECLYDFVLLCWWYKINYLHLHFTDDKCWTLPNTQYPDLPTAGMHYTVEQLTELNSFAMEHGVTIIPEVDVPGHSKILAQTLPHLVGNEESSAVSDVDIDGLLHPGLANTTPACTICPGRESTYQFLNDVIADLCQLFPNSPYIHIGGDEVNKVPWTNCVHCQSYMKEHHLPNVEELYRHFIVKMNELVVKHGKRTIAWEGFKVAGEVEIPRDIIVMEYECYYEHPAALLKAGYELVNTSWQPNYIVPTKSWPAEQILKWDVWRWEHFMEHSLAVPNGVSVAKSKRIFGAGMCSWDMEPDLGMSALRARLPALAERAWNTSEPVDTDIWMKQWEMHDVRLNMLLKVLK